MRKLRYSNQTELTALLLTVLITILMFLSVAPTSLAAVGDTHGVKIHLPGVTGLTITVDVYHDGVTYTADLEDEQGNGQYEGQLEDPLGDPVLLPGEPALSDITVWVNGEPYTPTKKTPFGTGAGVIQLWIDYSEPEPPEPSFEVRKSVNPASVHYGETLYFEIEVENTSDVGFSVYVEDAFLGIAEWVYLGPLATVTLDYMDTGFGALAYVTDEEDMPLVTNVVYATYGDLSDWDSVEAEVYGDKPPEPSFEVRKSVDPGSVHYGGTLYFEIELENTSSVGFEVYVEDALLGIAEWVYLGPMSTVTRTYMDTGFGALAYVTDEEDMPLVTNVVYATYGDLSDWDSVEAEVYGDKPPEPSFEVRKSVDPGSVHYGGTLYFEIELENTSDVGFSVYVEDAFLGIAEWVYLGPLATVTLDYEDDGFEALAYVTDEEDMPLVTNVVYATYGDDPSQWDSVEAEVYGDKPPEPVPDVQIVKDVDDSSIYRGQSVTYTITVTNTGDFTLYNLVVVDEILDEMFTISMLEPGSENAWTVDISSSPTSTVTNTAYVREDVYQLYDEDDAYVSVRTRPRPDPDPDPEPEPEPEPEPVPEPEEPLVVPEPIPEPEEPLALPYTGAEGSLLAELGALMLVSAVWLKRKF